MTINPSNSLGTLSSILICNTPLKETYDYQSFMEEFEAQIQSEENKPRIVFMKSFIPKKPIYSLAPDTIQDVLLFTSDGADFVRFGATCQKFNTLFRKPKALFVMRSSFAKVHHSKIDRLEFRQKELQNELSKKSEERSLALKAYEKNPITHPMSIFHDIAYSVIEIGKELDNLAPITWERGLKTVQSGPIYDAKQERDRILTVVDSAIAAYQAPEEKK